MARRRFTPEELNGLRELASQWGKIVARRAFGDDGPGLDADAESGLFRPFHRVNSSRSREFGGTGLGLAISRRLAERLGGTLGVRSAVGVGSTFSLAIAVLQQHEPVCHCPDCRRDFFPPAADLAP